MRRGYVMTEGEFLLLVSVADALTDVLAAWPEPSALAERRTRERAENARAWLERNIARARNNRP